jgi:hypothetical protein
VLWVGVERGDNFLRTLLTPGLRILAAHDVHSLHHFSDQRVQLRARPGCFGADSAPPATSGNKRSPNSPPERRNRVPHWGKVDELTLYRAS